ncbi:MAG: PD40 domain-containing protein [Cyclobacteriaceae bacterium]|nr:PD40 domain-containing protein [Cyclobacteriaceae bacterium]UYN85840.1 MAG: PD40 domain-containing protein [Cyclobacteriaceae bacterium]
MDRMKYLILHQFFFIAVLVASAQELDFSQSERLRSDINSNDEELSPLLSPDGSTLYFTRAFHSKNLGGKYAGTDIWISRKDGNGNWTPAVNAGKPWNNKRPNAVIGMSQDGKTVYLLNAYNYKSGISFSKLVNGNWTKPEFVPVPGINRDDFVGIYVHPSFEVMVISMKGKDSYGEEDIYISLKNPAGEWLPPKNLGSSINTSGFEISPFLSVDKSKLYFSSNGHGGQGGADIFVSERLYDSWDIWSVPKNLGSTINTSGFDSYFSIYADTIAYYSRNHGGKGIDLFSLKVSYVNNVLPAGSSFLSEEELNQIYPKRISTRLDFNRGISRLSNDQNEIVWFVANRILSRTGLKILIWIREEEDSKVTIERTNEIVQALRLVGLEPSRVFISTQNVKPELNRNGGGVIEILLFK